MSLIENALGKHRTEGAQSRTGAHLLDVLSKPLDPPHTPRNFQVDLESLRQQGYLPEPSEERRLADHYRQIKRPLIKAALGAEQDPLMRLILVTSPLPGDGKTFTSINLAMSLARERDTTALLIDADLPKAHISRAFGLHEQPGLIDALADDSLDIESLIFRTNIKGLDVLSAGQWNEGVTEMVSSARMSEIATRLVSRSPRRLVMMDSPPLLVSIEARALVQIPGQVVLVVRSGKTPRQAVLDAVGQIDSKKLQGLVLNDARWNAGSGYYDYSYYGAPQDGTSRKG